MTGFMGGGNILILPKHVVKQHYLNPDNVCYFFFLTSNRFR